MIEVARTNRRRHPRIDTDFPVFIEHVSGTSTVHAVDISEWGLRLSTLVGSNIARRGELTLRFRLPGEDRFICASACITSTRERQLELSTSTRFTLMNNDDATRLRSFVRTCLHAA